ncbi:asparaginyl-tRNA synthetase (plasmid) [Calothrix parasitica NIES-267]|uniref:Asparaginyl-tRNA synthetase n=1 Tax=Calothrix parasitica NIES-267 TaxID=1973488 RepID=A0A1Z4M2Z5_9CYAN|nr:asparaginyl-tRNA synthetase [Calothrix parasitica NIES-267]
MTTNSIKKNLIPDFIALQINTDNQKITEDKDFNFPEYKPTEHYLELTKAKYYKALLILRHYIKVVSDYYFGVELSAKNIDLFMLTPSISSPMGSGSDSEPIPIQFGKLDTFLTDSSQFGFEPLLMNGLDKVYCYLPSMRGEDSDKRHLNQFFHCEAEIIGTLEELLPIVENYIKKLAATLLEMPDIISKISKNPNRSLLVLKQLSESRSFSRLSFDEAVKLLVDNGYSNMINFTPTGRDISAQGEVKLMELLKTDLPVWITNYDRDRVPFYQKPSAAYSDKVINADLIFPSLIKNSFGGEIVGAGQRQDKVEEMYQSLERQEVGSESYEWYINLRRLEDYQTTSGFGIGIERFITWALCRDDIKEAIVYPRLKDVKTLP